MQNKKFYLDLNSLGRFSMSPWKSNIHEINYRTIRGVPNWIKLKKNQEKVIIEFLNKKFGSRISKFDLHDVGCNDGYFTEKLANLNFKKVIGSEPRKETILRGKKIRNLLKIKTKANYITYKLGNLKTKYKTDIVTCCGVIHHTNSIEQSFNSLLNLTKKILIVESEFLPSSLMKYKEIKKSKQIKDLFNKKNNKLKNDFSISIDKFESNFLDGSSIDNGLVETSTPSKLEMIAYQKNFKLIFFKEKKFTNFLNTNRCIMIFEKNKVKKKINFKKMNFEQELSMILDTIPISILDNIKKKKSINGFKTYSKILNDFKYSFIDKLNFEYAKSYLFLKKNYFLSKKYIEKIIYKKNADWFSCYKSFALLTKLDKKNSNAWKKRLYMCNPSFPKEVLNKIKIK